MSRKGAKPEHTSKLHSFLRNAEKERIYCLASTKKSLATNLYSGVEETSETETKESSAQLRIDPPDCVNAAQRNQADCRPTVTSGAAAAIIQSRPGPNNDAV